MKTIRNIGKVHSFSNGKAVGKGKANNFLEKLLSEFASNSQRYILETSESPFSFKEKQVHSIIAPAMFKITEAFLMEQPIQRKDNNSYKQTQIENFGWLDYWCRYKDIELFVELKHNFYSFNSKNKNIPQKIKQNWEYVNGNQLEKIKEEAKRFSENCKGVLLCSLHAITIYDYHNKHKPVNSIENYDKLIEIQKFIYNNISSEHKPNWTGIWMLNKKLTEKSFKDYDSHIQYYPSIIFISKIHEIITK